MDKRSGQQTSSRDSISRTAQFILGSVSVAALIYNYNDVGLSPYLKGMLGQILKGYISVRNGLLDVFAIVLDFFTSVLQEIGIAVPNFPWFDFSPVLADVALVLYLTYRSNLKLQAQWKTPQGKLPLLVRLYMRARGSGPLSMSPNEMNAKYGIEEARKMRRRVGFHEFNIVLATYNLLAYVFSAAIFFLLSYGETLLNADGLY